MSTLFQTKYDGLDGYLRVSTGRGRPTRASTVSPSLEGLLFIDIDGTSELDSVIRSIQHTPIPIAEYVLFRWPHIADESDDQIEDDIQNWLLELQKSEILPAQRRSIQPVGVLLFCYTKIPRIIWNKNFPQPPETDGILHRAIRAEVRSMMEWGHAIWRPRDYHYELPSGEHTDTFIRVADSFRSLRDIEVLATWFIDKLQDNLALVMDSASLLPLAGEIRRIMATRGWNMSGVETLDDYPRTKLDIQQALQSVPAHDKILAIMSVSASGRYFGILLDSMQVSDNEPELVVIIDKLGSPMNSGVTSSLSENVKLSRFIGLASDGEASPVNNTCKQCSSNDTSQIVRIDPQSFEAVALPGANLVMPSVENALELRDFFDQCERTSSLKLISASNQYSRAKGSPMGVRVDLSNLVKDKDFRTLVLTKLRAMIKESTTFGNFDHIVCAHNDYDMADFRTLLVDVMQVLEIDSESITVVEFNEHGQSKHSGDIKNSSSPLVFSLGSVSGWQLRQMLLEIQDAWSDNESFGTVSGLVVHARSTSKRAWENLNNSFERRLRSIWTMYLSDMSPLADEAELLKCSDSISELKQLELQSVEPQINEILRAHAHEFIRTRGIVCSPDSGDRHATLWGGKVESHVRNQSIYGRKLGTTSTLVAVGSAIHARRQDTLNTDPRWPMFDFVSIARSYYDGMLIACMLRWCNPSEIWWGATPNEQTSAVTALLARTRGPEDQRILFPEILLASTQGKLPKVAAIEAASQIVSEAAEWPLEDRAGIYCALMLMAESGFNVGKFLETIGADR